MNSITLHIAFLTMVFHGSAMACATTVAVSWLIYSVSDWPNAPQLRNGIIFIAQKLMTFYWHRHIHLLENYYYCMCMLQRLCMTCSYRRYEHMPVTRLMFTRLL